MVERSYDREVLANALSMYEDMVSDDFDIDEWIEDKKNVVLKEGDSLGLFEYEYNGVYSAHYAFSARGRAAIDLSRRMLNEMFARQGAKAIRGMTPIDNRAARWMNRQIGCTSQGVFETPVGTYELVTITLHEFYQNDKNKFKIEDEE